MTTDSLLDHAAAHVAPASMAPQGVPLTEADLSTSADGDHRVLLSQACVDLVSRLRNGFRPEAISHLPMPNSEEEFSKWSTVVSADELAGAAAAISGLIRKSLFAATLQPRDGGGEVKYANRPARGRIEGLARAPYFEIDDIAEGSILIREHGRHAYRLHGGDFAAHMASRVGMPTSDALLAWTTIPEAISAFRYELLPDLTVRNSGDGDRTALDVLLRRND